jgi:hypothetical protein
MTGNAPRIAFRSVLVLVTFAIAVAGVLVLAGVPGGSDGSAAAYRPIAEAPEAAAAPQAGPDASAGSYTVDCGVNRTGMRNADNLVVSPGEPGAAHHVHDYVGNLSTNAFSTEASLLAAGTTCTNGDRSSYYWPVLRAGPATDHDGHAAGTDAGILTPTSVRIEFGEAGHQRRAPGAERADRCRECPRFLTGRCGNGAACSGHAPAAPGCPAGTTRCARR